MSGHSKWHSIKHQKGIADAKRGAAFTKLANVITMAAKTGGGDPEFNFSLRIAIDKAKQSNMPKDKIEKAVLRGTGELDGNLLHEMVYEGFGPHHIAVVIESVTDNKNRAVADIKHIFSKHGGNLGSQNSVSWMFERRGVLRIPKETSEKTDEEIELASIDAGALDIKTQDEGLEIHTDPKTLQTVKESLEKQNIKVENANIEFVAKENITLENTAMADADAFFEALDENEDVKDYYTNLA
ncbi:MAG TPA: YebC/PmpR family DNA-binding transcriptional regulator [Patescibacteria group bacterium]|nr:YebC/PmpR family DNA-binding transcriptional regulator [Patescibacteria group bacterium]